MSHVFKHRHRMLFLKRFFTAPSTVGSITPSSPLLTKNMVRTSEIESCKTIIELGAGTGVFTQRILEGKSEHCNFYVFEKDPEFEDNLRQKFNGLSIYNDAVNLKELYHKGEIQQPDLVISGLPFAVLEPSVGKKILNSVYEVLPQGGKFITFQYSLNLYKTLKKMYHSVKLEFVPLNIPPAVVYRCTK